MGNGEGLFVLLNYSSLCTRNKFNSEPLLSRFSAPSNDTRQSVFPAPFLYSKHEEIKGMNIYYHDPIKWPQIS